MTDQTRADFEAHFQLTQRQAWQHKDGSYQFPEIQAKWEGWQAAVTMAAKAASATALTPAAWICIYDDGEVEYTPLLELAEAAPTAIPLYRAPPVEQDPNLYYNVPEDGGPITSYYAAPVAATAPGAVQENNPQLDGARQLPHSREEYGRMVRQAWVKWAQTQPNPKPSWLAPYDDLSEADKEADRQIGEFVARWTLIGDAARHATATPVAAAGTAECKHAYVQRQDKAWYCRHCEQEHADK